MWQLIHRQLLSSEASMNETQEAIQADENIGDDGNTSREMPNLDPKSDNSLNVDFDDQITAKEKVESHQTAAIKLVQEALNAILQSDAESYQQQSNASQGLADISLREHVSTSTASTEENFREGDELDGKDTSLASAESKHKMKQIDNKLRKEPDGREMSERHMSKSLSKLRKMFVTAKFIKAMERLKKINPRRPRYLSADPPSENEKVNLRHLSMNEKKNTEEWMLDNALRQVISRLDPDQQRRVAKLVEAFETVTPEQKEESSRHHPVKSVRAAGSKLAIPMKGEKKQIAEPEQDISLSHRQVVQQQYGVQAFLRSVPEHQKSATGDKTVHEWDETSMSDSTLVASAKSSQSEFSDSAFDDRGMGSEELNVASQFPDTEVRVASDMPTIFYNRQKYKSMWNMIYKHVVSSEASSDENHGVNGIDEHGETNNIQETNDKDSTLSDYSLDHNEDDNQSSECEKPELDQSAAIKLVKEALSAILKRHEQPTQSQSTPDHYMVPDDRKNLYNSRTTSCIEENPVEDDKQVENHTCFDVENKLLHVKSTSLFLQQEVECGELEAPQRKMSKSLSKLKKAFATARFIKAMERLTKSSPRKSQNPSSETTSEEERVNLRHRSMNERKKGEEWMLDFALRQVLSKMDPDQQRRVEGLVEAFEKVKPGQKEGIRSHSFKEEADDRLGSNTSMNEANSRSLKTQQQRSASIEEVPQNQNNGNLPPTGDASLDISLEEHHNQQVSSSETATQDGSQKRSQQKDQDQPMSLADSKDANLHSHHQVSLKGLHIDTPLNISTEGKGEIDANLMHEPLQHVKDPEQDTDTNITEGMYCEKQKDTSMWHLIYQHVKSASDEEAGSKLSERLNNEDQMNGCSTSSEIIADADSDDSDASSATSELNENDATKLVREAINRILNVPEHPEKKLTSGNEIATSEEDQRASLEEMPKKSLSRGYSKLKKLIICNKFIKAMEKTRKIHPQKQINPVSNSDSGAGKVHLKTRAGGERQGMNEWMLDNVLQKVIAGLAPVQQKRVALLVEAFEKVHPDVEGKRKGLDTTSSKKDAKEKEDTVSLTNSKYPDDFELKQNKSTTSTREVTTERIAYEITPGLTKEYSVNVRNWRSDGPCNITAATSDKDPTDIDVSNVPHVPLKETTESRDGARTQLEEGTLTNEQLAGNSEQAPIFAKKPPQPVPSEKSTSLWGLILQQVTTDMLESKETPEAEIDAEPEKESTSNEAGAQLKEGTLTDEQLVGNTEQAPISVEKPPQPVNMEDEWNYSAHKERSSEKSTSLWGLILQQVTTDMLERPETLEGEIDAEPQKDSTIMLEKRTDESAQVSSKTKSCRDMGVQTPTSFELQENEAIKVVEEAVEEILLLQDQIKDTEMMTSSTTLEQAVYSPENGYVREPSPAATETADIATTLHSVVTPEIEKTSSKEDSSNSYSTLSKVILCKRFVKAMGKMRKLKAMSGQNSSQPPHTEEKGNPSLRQISTSDKTSWEEGMLDNALQKVIGNLAPAKKQRVALLVQAFETVGSQPEATNSWRDKALVS